MIAGLRLLFALYLLVLLVGCVPQYERYPDPSVVISEAFPCQGFDDQNQPLAEQQVFPVNVERIYICAYQQKGGGGILTIEWDAFKKFFKLTYIEVDDGWFYPVLEAEGEKFPPGIYEVKIRSGRSVQKKTQFEIVEME